MAFECPTSAAPAPENGSNLRRHQPECPWQSDAFRAFMRLEEAFKGHTRGLPGLVWLPMKQPRPLTDEGREFGSLSRIASHHKRKVERRQHHVAKAGAVQNTLNPL